MRNYMNIPLKKSCIAFPLNRNKRLFFVWSQSSRRHFAVVWSKVTSLSTTQINDVNSVHKTHFSFERGWGASGNTDLKSGSSKTVDPVNLSSGLQKILHAGRVSLRRRFCQLILESHCRVHTAAAIVSVGRLFWQVARWCRFEEQQQLMKTRRRARVEYGPAMKCGGWSTTTQAPSVCPGQRLSGSDKLHIACPAIGRCVSGLACSLNGWRHCCCSGVIMRMRC